MKLLNPLTPGHFLVGKPLISVKTQDTTRNISLLTHWQLIQKQILGFWRQWQAEYLNRLQQRHKWRDVISSPCIGDVVILKEEDLPTAKWLLGRVTALHPGFYNLVLDESVICKGDNI